MPAIDNATAALNAIATAANDAVKAIQDERDQSEAAINTVATQLNAVGANLRAAITALQNPPPPVPAPAPLPVVS